MDHLIMREIGIISRCLNTISDMEFKEMGLEKGQYIIVVRVCENEGISQEEISNMIKVDRTTVAKSVKKLIEKGYIDRVQNESDKRAYKLFSTEKGKKTYEFLRREEDYSTKNALLGFSQEEKAKLLELLKRAASNVEREWKDVKNGVGRHY